jgi:hypothetical protein
MPPVCRVCIHPEHTEIDQQLVSGTSLRNIAKQFGTSATGLHRHRKHLPSRLVKAERAAQVADAGTLLDQVKNLLGNAQRLTEQAEQAQQLDVALRGIREVRGILELLGKLSGELQQNGMRIGISVGNPQERLLALLDGIVNDGDEDLEQFVKGVSDQHLEGMAKILRLGTGEETAQ